MVGTRLIWRLGKTLRPHWLFIIVIPVAILVMTAPTASLILDAATWRAPTRPSDIFMKYWDAWYLQEMLAGRADYFHTDLLFYPNNLSLAYHNFSLTHMFVFGALQSALPPVNAYALTYLLIIYTNAFCAYLFLGRVTSRRECACLGALVFALSPYVLSHQEHPDLALAASIPLTLYGLHRAMDGGRWRWLVFAGAAAGITVWIGMYVFICLLMTLGIYALALAAPRWQDKHYWLRLAALLLVAGAVSSPRIAPMLADRALLADVLQKTAGVERNNDLLTLFINRFHPLQVGLSERLYQHRKPPYHSDGYLGYVPLALIALALLRSRQRRGMLPWLVLALLFITLRLGSSLVVAGIHYPHVALPKQLLDELLPWLFGAFWDTSHFQIGILLPWAALVALSADWLLDRLPARAGSAALALILLAVAVEYYSPTIWHISSNRDYHAWIDWLDGEDSGADRLLIHLPMGRNNAKRYGYYQTFNRLPHVEGLASRTPPQAYATIEGNLLLRTWRAGDYLQCDSGNQVAWLGAVDELRAIGFTHIVYHRQLVFRQLVFASFVDVPSVYDDDYVTIFLVDDLRLACVDNPKLSDTIDRAKQLFSSSPALGLPQGMTALTVHDESLATLLTPHSEMSLDLAHPARRAHAERLLADSLALRLAYAPAQENRASLQAYREWLRADFEDCGAIADTADMRLEYWLRRGFPCALAVTAAPLQVDYDNGARLGNSLLDIDGRSLDLYLLWRGYSEYRSAFSLQLFDEAGGKALGADRVIDEVALAHHRLDTSALAAGEYRAKFIVYEVESRASVGGTLVAEGRRIQRELDLGRLELD